MTLGWYVRRLSRMSLAEMAHRSRDQLVMLLWRREAGDRKPVVTSRTVSSKPFPAPLPRGVAARVPEAAREALLAAANLLLESRWRVFSRMRSDLGPDPDWFVDISTGRRAPDRAFAPGIDHRDFHSVGHVKYVWELARHQHLTVLAAAFYLTDDERYAMRVREHLSSWISRSPFLTGIHWTSGIEIGLRLISWVWLRRLLHGWPDAPAVFEANPAFIRQVHDHQRYLATLPSHHSSANNHLVAEAAGLFASCCAFPFFSESDLWRIEAARTLRHQIPAQTFPCGHNRELATGYHLFVLELCLSALIEGEAAGRGLGDESWQWVARMMDALAVMVDCTLRPPRQGDSDDAHGILLDAPEFDRVSSLLTSGRSLVGPQPWWPQSGADDVRSPLWSALSPPRVVAREQFATRPRVLPGPGQVFLRADEGTRSEIWCRCDHGPLGFLATASHGHADALSIEVRVGGVDLLADPGTYCYQGAEVWRRYFRSTRAHNTLEIGGTDQAVDGGAFLWLRHSRCRMLEATGLDRGNLAVWEAEHDGYTRLRPPAVHRRRVELDRLRQRLTITDTVRSAGEHDCTLHFHLGPTVECNLVGTRADLRWPSSAGDRTALLDLPGELTWRTVTSGEDPPLGWYSAAFDVKTPATTLTGSGRIGSGMSVRSRLTLCRLSPDAPVDAFHGDEQWT